MDSVQMPAELGAANEQTTRAAMAARHRTLIAVALTGDLIRPSEQWSRSDHLILVWPLVNAVLK